MKTKLFVSTFVLLLFSLLGGGSYDGEALVWILIVFAVVFGGWGIVLVIISNVKSLNKDKRLNMIKVDEANALDFDRSVCIGDDHCKIYFDASKKQIMIMRVMTKGIKKEYVDGFEFPGKELATYNNDEFTTPVFNIYDPIRRLLLSGTYTGFDIIYQVTSIAEQDKNKDVSVNNTIQSRIETLSQSTILTTSSKFSSHKLYNILIEECRGLIAISESGKVTDVFNYINAEDLIKKTGNKSAINTQVVGNYMFIMDEFFKILVLLGSDTHEIFNYADIIEVSYEENGTQLYTKSANVGGAIVGGVLMGGAGAVVGGLSGDSRQNKEIKNMDIKILLRSTSRTTFVLHFMDIDRELSTKKDFDKGLYETYLKNANRAKDILSVIIDNAKQTAGSVVQSVVTPASSSVADELSKLAKLKADGILTEEEFQVQKSKLLGV